MNERLWIGQKRAIVKKEAVFDCGAVLHRGEPDRDIGQGCLQSDIKSWLAGRSLSRSLGSGRGVFNGQWGHWRHFFGGLIADVGTGITGAGGGCRRFIEPNESEPSWPFIHPSIFSSLPVVGFQYQPSTSIEDEGNHASG